jgi:arylformamidase
MRAQLKPDWLQAQYDNRALVSDFATVMQGWFDASALARQNSRALLDVPYGPDPSEKLDVFLPALGTEASTQANTESSETAAGAPVLIFIHGGYWRALDKADFSFVAPAFNAQGALVLVPNYALCPAVSIEHIVLQMAAVVVWAWRHAAQHGGDPARIALVGHSAGGHLATMLLSCRWADLPAARGAGLPPQPLAGALSISGLFDLEPLRHTPFLQADLRLTPASVARLSPAFFARPKGAKLMATVGLDESDEFRRQTQLIREVWGPTAVPVCETLPHCNHFTVLHQLANPKGRLHHLALRLLGLA